MYEYSSTSAFAVSLVEEFFGTKGWDVGTVHSEPCLFVLLSPDNTVSILIVYVDDCRVQGERDEDVAYIKTSFEERFGIKHVDPRYFLGCLMEIEDQGGYSTLSITQPDFVEDMLIKYAVRGVHAHLIQWVTEHSDSVRLGSYLYSEPGVLENSPFNYYRLPYPEPEREHEALRPRSWLFLRR